jgi:hypothetical protein
MQQDHDRQIAHTAGSGWDVERHIRSSPQSRAFDGDEVQAVGADGTIGALDGAKL